MHLTSVSGKSGEAHLAATKGNAKIVKELITRGADINAKTTDGHTALEAAAISGSPETKALLMQAGAK